MASLIPRSQLKIIGERVYLSREVVKEAVLEGKKVFLPDVVIEAPTLETWGLSWISER